MLYMLINRTRIDLTKEQYEQLGKLAQDFYANIPEDVILHNDWAANDNSCTFALLETDNPDLLRELQAPFCSFVDIETIPVTPIKGWDK